MLVLCGLPGSGKTSLCKYLLDHLISAGPDVKARLISVDEHVAQAGDGGGAGLGSPAGFSPENWKVKLSHFLTIHISPAARNLSPPSR